MPKTNIFMVQNTRGRSARITGQTRFLAYFSRSSRPALDLFRRRVGDHGFKRLTHAIISRRHWARDVRHDDLGDGHHGYQCLANTIYRHMRKWRQQPETSNAFALSESKSGAAWSVWREPRGWESTLSSGRWESRDPSYFGSTRKWRASGLFSFGGTNLFHQLKCINTV